MAIDIKACRRPTNRRRDSQLGENKDPGLSQRWMMHRLQSDYKVHADTCRPSFVAARFGRSIPYLGVQGPSESSWRGEKRRPSARNYEWRLERHSPNRSPLDIRPDL